MGPSGLTITPTAPADPAKPVESADVHTRVDTGGRTQVRVQVSPAPSTDPADKKPEDKKPEAKVEDKPADAAPQRPSWLPEKFANPMALKTATIELAKKQGAPAYVIRGLEASESGQEVSDAYKEFEKKIDPNAGKPAEKKEEPVANTNTNTTTNTVVVKSDADKAYEREAFGEYVADMLDKVGIRAVDLGAEFEANGRKLTPETYAKFAKAGVTKTFLDSYIAGSLGNAQSLAEASIKEAKDSIGGGAEFTKVATWASANLTKEQHETYTVMTNSGSVVAAKEAVRMLKGWYDEANGKPPKLLIPDAKGGGEQKGYGSKEEMMADMRDPRYKAGDLAFHAKVEEKLKHTNL